MYIIIFHFNMKKTNEKLKFNKKIIKWIKKIIHRIKK